MEDLICMAKSLELDVVCLDQQPSDPVLKVFYVIGSNSVYDAARPA